MSAIVVATLLALAPPVPAPAAPPASMARAPARQAAPPSHGPSKAAAKAASKSGSQPSSSSSSLQQVGGGDPFFTRDEPALASARRALEADDADLAVDRAREAVSSSADERAVVEYDAAQALRARARKDAAQQQAAQQQAGQQQQQGAPQQGAQPGTTQPSTPGAPQGPPPNLDDAIASFDRAAGLAVSPRLQSEARLAAGNAALEAGKIDDAISALRKAVVADPNNERARRNLQRALEAKKAQPPPPPQQGGDKNDDKKNDDQKDDKHDGKQDQQKQDQQKSGDDKNDKQDQQKQDQQQSGADPKDQQKQDQQPSGADQKDQQKQDQQQGGSAGEQSKPKKTSKDEKRRLLQGLRSRERPLTPWEMRGVDKKRAPGGKDW